MKEHEFITTVELNKKITKLSWDYDQIMSGAVQDKVSWIIEKSQFLRIKNLEYTIDDVGLDMYKSPFTIYGYSTWLHILGMDKPCDFLCISPDFLVGDVRGLQIEEKHVSDFMKKLYRDQGGRDICQEIIGKKITNVVYNACFPVYRQPQQSLSSLPGLRR